MHLYPSHTRNLCAIIPSLLTPFDPSFIHHTHTKTYPSFPLLTLRSIISSLLHQPTDTRCPPAALELRQSASASRRSVSLTHARRMEVGPLERYVVPNTPKLPQDSDGGSIEVGSPPSPASRTAAMTVPSTAIAPPLYTHAACTPTPYRSTVTHPTCQARTMAAPTRRNNVRDLTSIVPSSASQPPPKSSLRTNENWERVQ